VSTALQPAGSSGAATGPVPAHADPFILVDGAHGRHLRWRPGERLEHLFEQRCAQGSADRPCVDAPGAALSYAEVDARANQLARHLLMLGIGSGDRVALLFDDVVQAYVAMLAVLKAGAAFVPLDPGFPPERIGYIVSDAAAMAVVSLLHLQPCLALVQAEIVAVDDLAERIGAESRAALTDGERGPALDELAYVIYTSGSTGRPKGVAVEHSSIVNFVRVAAEVYGYRPDDRVYQGLTIAFDFSFEEIWVPWAVGATLVPKPPGGSLLGVDLHEFLTEHRVSAMCCVPTLLATLEDDLPALRFLLVSGEACPHDLVLRWHRPGRRFLNVYGPTEATVSATWAVLHPERSVTIGVPLPTYSTVILDTDDPSRALPHGQLGEIGIAGIGLARGYVNRDDLTGAAFVPDFLGVPGNVSGRIYRTGDLGRVTADGEIEYLGRVDLQVKIRGYRIELTEIESVLLQMPGIAQVVVDTHEPVSGTTELVAYYSLRTGAARPGDDALRAHLRERLPPYMVPAYLELLPVVPMTTAGKADRKALPRPTTRRTTDGEFVAPTGPIETVLAELLATTLGVERVSVRAHLFDDLGADSLLLAQFSAQVRTRTTLPSIAMRDMYLHPTLTALATLADAGTSEDAPAAPGPSTCRSPVTPHPLCYLLCGAVQLVLFLVSVTVAAALLVVALEWVRGGATFVGLWQRSMVISAVMFSGYFVLSTAAKWVLVGPWKAQEFPLWGARYLRFWVVQRILRANPLAVFAGSPLYNLYLRCLGARVGPGAVILTRAIPVCTDLLTIGRGTIVRKDTHLTGYRAVAGRIQTGPITIGADAVVGEQSVLDIGAVMGNGAQLGHASSLQSGQVIPDGESWHGSPAVRCDVDYRLVAPARCGRLRRFAYGLWQLANVLVLSVPLGLALVLSLLERIPPLLRLMQPGTIGDPAVHLEVVGYITALFVVGVVAGLVFVAIVPRVVHRGLREDAVHPLYGIRYWLYRIVARTTNSRFYCVLFGDSSAILHYLRLVGYRFGRPLVQSGSNFGVEVRHENPYLSGVGSGTMVSDGLSVMNAEYSSTSFRLRRAELGSRNFLGNNIAYPAGARVGDNCLLATKVMVPIDGTVRHDIGLLGSPAFEIPRTVERDHAFDHLKGGRRHRRLLRAKNRHNTVTAAVYLLAQIVILNVVSVFGTVAFDLYFERGFWVVPVATVAALVFGIGFQILLERAVTSFRAMSPRFCSIYDPYFWWHERFWKMSIGQYLGLFNGTPMKVVVWRLLGVRIGRRVFDDGCAIPEKSLVHIGDDVALNAGSTVQAHSLEDGVFKSDHIVIGHGVTVGPRAFVHYGVTLHEGAVLDVDAFLMKGQEVPPHTRWRGNPAAETHDPHVAPPTSGSPPTSYVPTSSVWASDRRQ